MTPRPLDLGPIATLTQLSHSALRENGGHLGHVRLAAGPAFLCHPPLMPIRRRPFPTPPRDRPRRSVISQLPRVRRGWRVFLFYSSAVLLTGLVSMLFADLLWRTGWSSSGVILLCLFIVLFFAHRHGLHARRVRVCPAPDRRPATSRACEITARKASRASAPPWFFPSTTRKSPASARACAPPTNRLEKTGHLERFDFFILSDSTDPDKWVEEERRWFDLVRGPGCAGADLLPAARVQRGKKERQHPGFSEHLGARATATSWCSTPTA